MAAEWSRIVGIKPHTILKRLDKSALLWTVGQALGFDPAPTEAIGRQFVSCEQSEN